MTGRSLMVVSKRSSVRVDFGIDGMPASHIWTCIAGLQPLDKPPAIPTILISYAQLNEPPTDIRAVWFARPLNGHNGANVEIDPSNGWPMARGPWPMARPTINKLSSKIFPTSSLFFFLFSKRLNQIFHITFTLWHPNRVGYKPYDIVMD
ncbi:hypothetical protein V1478_017094 [Vespula squamosa]|uniref:Uncharacterized protein n=1 Tax=Vespula squamosa TaxID=30214 RepID=A0ABD1ZYG0_VESSQ